MLTRTVLVVIAIVALVLVKNTGGTSRRVHDSWRVQEKGKKVREESFLPLIALGAAGAGAGAFFKSGAKWTKGDRDESSVSMFKDTRFQGPRRDFPVPHVQNSLSKGHLGLGFNKENDTYSSMIVPKNTKVTLYVDNDLKGKSVTLGPGRHRNLSAYGMHDNVSSFTIQATAPAFDTAAAAREASNIAQKAKKVKIAKKIAKKIAEKKAKPKPYTKPYTKPYKAHSLSVHTQTQNLSAGKWKDKWYKKWSGKTKKNDTRRQCDYHARNNTGAFNSCAGLRGKARHRCVRRNMKRCLKDVSSDFVLQSGEADKARTKSLKKGEFAITVYEKKNFKGQSRGFREGADAFQGSSVNFPIRSIRFNKKSPHKLVANESGWGGRSKTFTKSTKYVGKKWDGFNQTPGHFKIFRVV